MLNLAKGYKIYEPERLNEEYEVTDDVTLMASDFGRPLSGAGNQCK